MLEKLFRVRYLPVKNSFCYVSPSVAREFETNAVVKINYNNDKEVFLSVASSSHNLSNDFIGISSLYAKLLEIEEDSTIVLSKIHTLSRVESFIIHTIRHDDYDVLNSLKEEVENCVLQQTKLVNQNQKFTIWIGDNLNISVNVVSVSPVKIGLLDNLTELVIIPTIPNSDHKKFVASSQNTKDDVGQRQIKAELFNIIQELTPSEMKHEQKIANYFRMRGYSNGRIVPFDCLGSSRFSEYLSEFNVFVSKSCSKQEEFESFREPIFCCLKLTNAQQPARIFVRAFLIDNILQDDVISNNIFVHKHIFKIFNCKIGASVCLKPIRHKNMIDKIIVNIKEDKVNALHLCKEFFAKMVNIQHNFIVNADFVVKLCDNIYSILEFIPKSPYCCIDEDFLRNCKFEIRENREISDFLEEEKTETRDFIGLDSHRKISDNLLKTILGPLRTNTTQDKRPKHVLINGNIGSGKSTIIDRFISLSSKAPYFVYSEVVKCRKIKGKTLDSMHRIFITIFENLISHQPSILFIDDLHVLCENICNGEASGQNALYFDRLSEMLYSLFTCITSFNQIGIIATTDSLEKLNKNIYSTRGRYLFEDIYRIEELTKKDREQILKSLMKDKVTEIDFGKISEKTDGYAFQDLYDLVRKAVFQFMKNDSPNSIIGNQHFEDALSQMTIISLADVKLHSPGDKNFSNIGGLENIKNQLHEVLLWPLRFPKLFDNAPLRLQSGILLYGHPGTGKTLLAAATAKEFGLRLISVKGPELLSKYIGASEQAVRDVFIQAHNARPCILFFDEFDSLAPRRGHDITGVTDRVVNQLLTQMDGVESLSGVCVLAATSRPDLLDPALLRPGRLDKQILCPLPDEESRLEILKALSKFLKLSNDVNLEEFARKTNGFSGADLQSFLYNAQLSGMEHLMLPGDNKDNESELIITHELLKTCLSNTRPSLTKQEKEKYNFIYSKFQGKSDVRFIKPGTRASLA